MKLVLVTGMSGAGKSVALKTLEDCGFEAIDNLPLSFIPDVAGSSAAKRNLALSADIRSRDFSVEHFLKIVEPLRNNSELESSVLFLDCDDEVLRRRFTETRRRHPLSLDRTVIDGIRHERGLIEGIRDVADKVIDTSDYEAAKLREVLISEYASAENSLSLVLTSFSYKRGIPREADIVFDVRFLKNPHYDPACKLLTGKDALVGAYIESDEDFKGFYDRLSGLLLPLLPRYRQEGKKYLTIAIGCTGGRHRSVYMVQKLGGFLKQHDYTVTLRHREL
jgi:RNase adapter protein RapZ